MIDPIRFPAPSTAEPHPFGALLRRLRIRMGLSQNQLARQTGIDPAYVNQIERGGQATSTGRILRVVIPGRAVVLSLATALGSGPADTERLLIAAGLVPVCILKLPTWNPVIGDIADALGDPDLDDDDRAELTELLRIVAARWRKR